MFGFLPNFLNFNKDDGSGSSNPPPAKRARTDKENVPENDEEETIIQKTEEVQEEEDAIEAEGEEQRFLRFDPVEYVEFEDNPRIQEDDGDEEEQQVDADIPLVKDDDEDMEDIGTDEHQEGSTENSSELPKRSMRGTTVQLREQKQKEWKKQDELEKNKESARDREMRRMQEKEEDAMHVDTVQKPLIKESVQTVDYDENATFVAAETRRRQMIEDDPMLKEHLEFKMPETIEQDVIEYKTHHVIKNLEENFENQKKKVAKRMSTQKPGSSKTNKKLSKKRIRIMQNITGNRKEVIPVYCDISRNVNEVDIPPSLTYKYSDTNVTRRAKLDELDKQIEEEMKNIKCDCHDQTPVVKCWENPSCPCYQTNLKLREEFQIGKKKDGKKVDNKKDFLEYDYKPTEFATHKPVYLKPGSFDNVIGFACSELCHCKGHCTNNVTLLVDKKLNSFELERKNKNLGFQVKSQNCIPAGTVIAEFTGEAVKSHDLVERDYAYQVVNPYRSDVVTKLLKVMGHCPEELEKSMRKAYRTCLYIDPKHIGNVARTFNTKCESNVEVLRVYQKSFSPSNIRLLVVTTESIFPGDELNLDYGSEYSKYLPGGCNCGAVSCKNNVVASFPNKKDKAYKKNMIALKNKIAKEIQDKHSAKFNIYKSQVLDKI
ncbi:hypothetical protein GCK72_025187 [Caenorhabditis remanei]|uniref:SET domain-containing protein n=1 Tax=Caenorhabditis remanei TaxID=31234 RepID=A0A6A5G185_CAERE|nr:hypothetical protein GCK72_025187 [Caenorhabditis remanei]KAF1748720.1 hypothetical protein GCK72_025187 [Caenorhabditis remanei]